ncbi:hypothetical protein [Amnibacterium endophyticum]|uniref:Uncharacterized protein n=1 Tax=Amnibacterium endophyticum TaxID=2109337 RepID=A0ABW4LIL8_9MICO
MSSRVARRFAEAGVALAIIGLIGSAVFQLQPWRTCPDDTSSAACPMLRADYDAFLLFALVLLAGCVLLLGAGVVRLKRAQ